MDKQTPKRTPHNREIKRLFVPAKGKYVHRLYPKEYFKQYWFNEPDSNGIKAVAKILGVSKRKATHIIFEYGFKHIMGLLVNEELDAMDTPEG